MNEGTPAERTHETLQRIQDGLWAVDAEVSAEQGVESGAVVSSALSFAEGEIRGQVITELVKDDDAVLSGPEVLRRWRFMISPRRMPMNRVPAPLKKKTRYLRI